MTVKKPKPLRIAVLNYSGNVGKTIVASHLLKSQMPNARLFSIETINVGADADGIDVEKLRGKAFGQLADELMVEDEAIIDVGASNIEEFLKMMQQYAGSHEDIDLFVVPVVKENKVQSDTVNTIRTLQKIGVPKEKIRLVFNKVDMTDDVEDEFVALFGLAATEKSFVIDKQAVIYHNEIFERMKRQKTSLGQLNEDTTDYRVKLRGATDEQEREHCVNMIAMKRLAISANANLDSVYASITR